MRVLHLNASDIRGGAGRAAYRIHSGLRNLGIDSLMHVQSKCSDDWTVSSAEGKYRKLASLVKSRLDPVILKRYPGWSKIIFSPALVPDDLVYIVNKLDPDIVHLHWMGHAFMKIETLRKLKKPIVWTMHDLWAVTGGCHYPGECTRYYEKCGHCPELGSTREHDLSRKVWLRKQAAWSGLSLSVASPSVWLSNELKSSALLKSSSVQVLSNGIDCEVFKPIDKTLARNILSLPKSKKLVLYGAMSSTSDKRKGFSYLHAAITKLAAKPGFDDAELVVFGASAPRNQEVSALKTRYLGQLSDDVSLALLYSAVDVFVAPSVQDNLPNTVMESMACGTPVVAFEIGGMPDMIIHRSTGYLAHPFDEEDLANGIAWVLADNGRRNDLSLRCRAKVEEEYDIVKISGRYLSLYRDCVGGT